MKADDILARMLRPVEFASKDSYAHLSTVRDLERFIRRSSDELLKSPISQQARLLLKNLRGVMLGFDDLPLAEKRERLDQAGALLQEIVRDISQPQEGSGRRAPSKKRSVPLKLDTPIEYASGVGPARGRALRKMGVDTIGDALFLLPRRYEDRGRLRLISQLRVGEWETFYGRVLATDVHRRRGGRKIFRAIVGDSSGSMTLVWFNFNEEFMRQRFRSGGTLIGYGRVEWGRGDSFQVHHPEVEILSGGDEDLLHTGRIVPIYPLTAGLNQRVLRTIMGNLIPRAVHLAEEIFTPPFLRDNGLIQLPDALRGVHLPAEGADVEGLNSGTSPEHRRLIFQELFLLELGMALRRNENRSVRKGRVYPSGIPKLVERFRSSLPFRLTAGQERAVGEILEDLAGPHPMNRLLQGDVGCGKTVVAIMGMLAAVGSGYQSALMAPTEILAEQHYRRIARLTERLGIQVALITGSLTAGERREVIEGVRRGSHQMVVGTHALIQEGVEFRELGLVVIDEQHRFGVLQRSALKEKGSDPDLLVMTATPIPRSLSMVLYGDMDLSIIRDMPPGRVAVETLLLPERRVQEAYSLIRREAEKGRQAYVVYPLLEESEKVDLKAAREMFLLLKDKVFPGFRLALLHGRMKGEEKEAVMEALRRGEVDVLVSTTVVEVGVDVPNCSVMLVEHAERFGLAQLHQLRGRVGRGRHPSTFIMVAREPATEDAVERLETVRDCLDGFTIAERDLELRGPGEVMGTRQSGIPELRFVDLVRDVDILKQARDAAFRLAKEDPKLSRPENRLIKAELRRQWEDKLKLAGIG